MLHYGDCVTDCPRFYLANFYGDECYPISDIDVKLIYFPFLIVTAVCFGLSYVGTIQKKKHRLVPNFIVLMGIVEHCALVTQFLCTLSYGTWRYLAFILIFWGTYVTGNIIFYKKHY